MASFSFGGAAGLGVGLPLSGSGNCSFLSIEWISRNRRMAIRPSSSLSRQWLFQSRQKSFPATPQPARAAVRVRAPIPASRSSGSMAGNAASACSSCKKTSPTEGKRAARHKTQNRRRQVSQRSRTPAAVRSSAMRNRFCSCGAVPCASSSMLFKSTASRGICLRSCFMSVRLLGSLGWFVHPHERNPTQKDDFLQKTSQKVHIPRCPASVSRICCASRRRF